MFSTTETHHNRCCDSNDKLMFNFSRFFYLLPLWTLFSNMLNSAHPASFKFKAHRSQCIHNKNFKVKITKNWIIIVCTVVISRGEIEIQSKKKIQILRVKYLLLWNLQVIHEYPLWIAQLHFIVNFLKLEQWVDFRLCAAHNSNLNETFLLLRKSTSIAATTCLLIVKCVD